MFPGDHLANTGLILSHLIAGKIEKTTVPKIPLPSPKVSISFRMTMQCRFVPN